MASIYKRKGKGFYLVSWFDCDGRRREKSTRTTDHKAAERIAAKLENDAALRREGIIDAAADGFAAAARRPVAEHLADFIAELSAKRVTAKQTRTVGSRITKIIELCNIETLTDLSPNVVQTAIGSIRDGGASVQTCNHAIRAIKQFTRWLVRDRRLARDPIQHLKTSNPDADRRHVRRELTDDELTRLIATAEAGPDWTWRTGLARRSPTLTMTGPDRAMLYHLAVGSGFRVSEMGSLTPESFNLDDDPPTVTVTAACSKRRCEDVQPIRRDLAERLRPWLAHKVAHEPVFTLPDRTADMLRADLEAAGIPYIDGAGHVADFHALRHTYISRVVSSGASVKVAQELARHSTPTLTIGRYAHIRMHDLTEALSSLPSSKPKGDAREVAAATGTFDESATLAGDGDDVRIRQTAHQQIPQQSATKHTRSQPGPAGSDRSPGQAARSRATRDRRTPESLGPHVA